jgi:hypothetical protein
MLQVLIISIQLLSFDKGNSFEGFWAKNRMLSLLGYQFNNIKPILIIFQNTAYGLFSDYPTLYKTKSTGLGFGQVENFREITLEKNPTQTHCLTSLYYYTPNYL